VPDLRLHDVEGRLTEMNGVTPPPMARRKAVPDGARTPVGDLDPR
jgi:hypothetical protein